MSDKLPTIEEDARDFADAMRRICWAIALPVACLVSFVFAAVVFSCAGGLVWVISACR